MSEEYSITVTHNGVEITHHEKDNLWRFTLRGRDRSAESLAKAKEAVDKPVKNSAKTEFKRIPAIFIPGWGDIEFGEITSIAEQTRRDEREVWFVNSKDGERRKRNVRQLYLNDEENNILLSENLALKKEADLLRDKAARKITEMKKVSLEITEE